MRLSAGLVVGASFALTAATVANAFLLNKQFYPSVVYLTKSSPSMAVMYGQSLILVYLLFQVVRGIFFGDLRASESEHLSERAWHAVMETCLAFTVFRDDFSPLFVMLFVGLLFVKSFHWLSDDRVDMMERSPVITLKFHMRMMSLIAFLGAIDSYMVSHAYFTTLVRGASAQIVFGFEYAVLMTMVIHVTIKYVLHMHDLRSAAQWENKQVYLLYAELLINGMRVLLYGAFVLIMMRVHTFPLFSVRPFYLSLKAFHKALNDVLLSRRAIHAMNNLFPVVTEEELATMDTTCIICREEMTTDSGAKRLPCSHVFHANCLRSWFQRQQTCPTCRTDILSRAGQAARNNAGVGGANNNAGGGNNGGGGQNNGANQGQQLPANMFPFVAHQFGFQLPRQFNQVNGGGNNQQGQAEQDPTGAAGGQAPPFTPFFMPPPFPVPPGMGMFPPPPFPPSPFAFPGRPSFSGLTDEELRNLEGESRASLEARVRVLSDISTLLDAAVLQMQQYSSVMSAHAPPVIPSSATPSTQSSSDTSPAHSSNATNSTVQDTNGHADSTSSSSHPTPSTPSTSSTPNQKSLFGAGVNGVSSSTSARPDDSPSTSVQTNEGQQDGTRPTQGSPEGGEEDPLNEIRQRRLQRFAE